MFRYIQVVHLHLSWIALPFLLSCFTPSLQSPPSWGVSATTTLGVHGPTAPKPVTLEPNNVKGNLYLTSYMPLSFMY